MPSLTPDVAATFVRGDERRGLPAPRSESLVVFPPHRRIAAPGRLWLQRTRATGSPVCRASPENRRHHMVQFPKRAVLTAVVAAGALALPAAANAAVTSNVNGDTLTVTG